MTEYEISELTNQVHAKQICLDEMTRKYKDRNVTCMGMALMAAIFIIASFVAIFQRDGWQERYNTTRKEAITYGFAQYNPTNGVWEWNKSQ